MSTMIQTLYKPVEPKTFNIAKDIKLTWMVCFLMGSFTWVIMVKN